MPLVSRPMPYRLQYPLDEDGIEQLDEMLEILFSDLEVGAVQINLDQIVAGPGGDPFVIGDLFYADSVSSIATLAAVSAGSYLRSAGVATAPVWSTLKLPNSAAQGDILYADAADNLTLLNKSASATRYLSNTGASNNPAWAQVDLSNGVTGRLPYANITAATAASTLLGRRSASAGDWEEITLGTGISMSGTVLSATGVAYEPLTNGDSAFPEIIFADGDVVMVEMV